MSLLIYSCHSAAPRAARWRAAARRSAPQRGVPRRGAAARRAAPCCGALPVGTLAGPAASARVISIVNGNDVVPRLLGSKLSFTRKLLLEVMASANAKKHAANEQLLDTFEAYTALPQTELVFVYHGQAQSVSANEQHLVLHLAEALHPRGISDHLGYVVALETASNAGHWTPPKPAIKVD